MKKFRIIKKITGKITSIYSLVLDDSVNCVFEQFITDFYATHKSEIDNLVVTIDNISDSVGIRASFFKDQGIGSIFRFINYKDKKSSIRLYCIKWGSGLLILGGGGIKNVRTWQESQELSLVIHNLEKIDRFLYENKINIDEAANTCAEFIISQDE